MAIDPAKIKKIHQKLLTDISDEVPPNGEEYENISTLIKGHVPRGRVEGKSLIQQFEQLSQKGKLKPGKYDILEEVCSGNAILLSLINDAKEKINNGQATPQLSGPSTGPSTDPSTGLSTGPSPGPSTGPSTGPSPGPSTGPSPGPSTGPSTSNNSAEQSRKRTAQDLVVTDSPKRLRQDSADNDSTYFYPKGDKKGLLLILNSTTNRSGTEYDVHNLKQFFQEELQYVVYDPRSQENDDLTTAQLNECFSDVKQLMNCSIGKEYYCFICVILSHGNEKGIRTKDGFIDTETIRREFNNRQVPNFSGRPKIFLIQACRGSASQQVVPTDLSDDDSETPEDESDEIVNVPTDADTLLAFSTTPGYRSNRRLGVGSWFIKECTDVFKQNYRSDHLEEMLITVRGNVAFRWQRNDGTRQMPCVWSTLTRRLKL